MRDTRGGEFGQMMEVLRCSGVNDSVDNSGLVTTERRGQAET